MTLQELIDLAVTAKGTRREVATGLHQSPQRLTDWKAGTRKPDAHEIAYLAQCAGLPVLQTVAEIESQLDNRYSSIWRDALGKLTAAGIAASVIGAVSLSPSQANAATTITPTVKPTVYIMSTNELRRTSNMAALVSG